MALNRSRDFCANFAQLLRNTATIFAPPKLCLGKMSDGKLPPVLHPCRCVHHYQRQKAATGGKLPATKGVILRQVRCRFLSLFAAPVLPRFFHNDFVRRWCLVANRVSTAFTSSPFVARPERMATARREWFAVVSLAVVVVWPWSWLGCGRFAAGLAKRLAPASQHD